MMRFTSALSLALLLGGAAIALSGCGPTYPKCENDGHCDEKGEFCVNGLCQQCRDNSHCSGAGQICSGGRCQVRPGYCDGNISCPSPQKCRDNECGAECLPGNANDCAGTDYCDSGRCLRKPLCGEHADNPACGEGEECVGGRCQTARLTCSAQPVYFDYDRSRVKSSQRSKLDELATCLKQDGAPSVLIEGHCDERGSDEYNLALGEQRASSSRRYLIDLGVTASRIATRSYGEERPASSGSNESAWSKNRRSEFTAQ